jgi:hypothetical protein
MRPGLRAAASTLALALAVASCATSGVERPDKTTAPPRDSPSPSLDASAPPTSAPEASSAEVPVVGRPDGSALCTRVLGMSVTYDWFIEGGFEVQPGIEDAGWELAWESGHDVAMFADPGAVPYTMVPLSSCGREPDRVVFQIAARDFASPDAVVAELRSSIDNIRAAWPTVDLIELIPIVGGPGGEPCSDPDVPDKGVHATIMYPAMVSAIAAVENGVDVVAGPDLRVADCALFRDGAGHLTVEGSALVAAELAEHYGA